MPFPILPSNSATGYFLNKSLRLRSSANCYLNRTFGTPTSNLKYTMSMWLKRGRLGAQQSCFFSYNGGSEYAGAYFSADDKLNFIGDSATGGRTFGLTTNAVFRDPSAWYHLVFVFDSANATVANRCIIYVNNVSQSLTGTTVPSNAPSYFNTSGINGTIGQNAQNTSYFDGYLAEVNFIDGQALTPSSFGSYNSLTGVWQPAKYTGTYGNNGFYLPFTNNASTTTIGYDFSGNGNNWTTNNISLTAGTTYDSMTDVPTLTSATTANYCVINPLQNGGLTVTNGNLTWAGAGSAFKCATGSIAMPSGKWYFEAKITGSSGGNWGSGVCNLNPVLASNPMNYPTGWGVLTGGGGTVLYKWHNSSYSVLSSTSVTGSIVGFAIDVDAGKMWFSQNGTWLEGDPSAGTGASFTNLTGTQIPFATGYDSNDQGSTNFGQQGFSYTPPTGYVALNTYNLPTSTIVAGNTVMDATIYTGDGSQTKSFTNTFGFKPDLVWSKIRSGTTQGTGVFDSVRGTTGQSLDTASTSAEGTWNAFPASDYGYVSAFNSNGFSVDDGSVATTGGYVNYSGRTYVAWQWQAGQGTTSSNTNGSITSTVSVNASAGFSVVTYTGTGSAATIGHGLGVAPKMIICKNRVDGSTLWSVYHASVGAGSVAHLNTTAAFSSSGDWNSTTPTSSVYSTNGSSRTNASGQAMVAYCWTPIPGYSAMGSYTGNGSADGPFVYTGFRPKFIMWKRSDSTGDWIIFDSSRNPYNYADLQLCPNTSGAEQVTGGGFVREDLLSNGFKVRSTDSYINANGGTYIYMAFAENPFKNALAR